MKTKRYWLRGGLFTSIFIIVITVLEISGAVHNLPFIQRGISLVRVGLLVPVSVIPQDLLLNKYQNENIVLIFFIALIFWFIIGALLGYIYGKIKKGSMVRQ